MTVSDMTMADLMSARPAVVPVLLRHGLACPGCAMAPFMTVREAADAYGLELGVLLADLAAADSSGSDAGDDQSPASEGGFRNPRARIALPEACRPSESDDDRMGCADGERSFIGYLL
ncbi:DUF1858 domain-containing protein [Azospirillum sp. 412522]|nr:DUF1858 domain-containing protein [Azospirillum sp. 412522]MBY6265166.1 DUF1858 domain-containing protein [Azospirillum sp. 412522]